MTRISDVKQFHFVYFFMFSFHFILFFMNSIIANFAIHFSFLPIIHLLYSGSVFRLFRLSLLCVGALLKMVEAQKAPRLVHLFTFLLERVCVLEHFDLYKLCVPFMFSLEFFFFCFLRTYSYT